MLGVRACQPGGGGRRRTEVMLQGLKGKMWVRKWGKQVSAV